MEDLEQERYIALCEVVSHYDPNAEWPLSAVLPSGSSAGCGSAQTTTGQCGFLYVSREKLDQIGELPGGSVVLK